MYFHGSDFRRVTPDDPAQPGETIILYALGLGEVTPAIAAGAPAPNSAPVTTHMLPLQLYGNSTDGSGSYVYINLTILWEGYAPGMVGVYQINAQLPANLKPGRFTLEFSYCDGSCPGPALDVRY